MRRCDWCGSTARVIGEDYPINGNAIMAVVKCDSCHHEWNAVVYLSELAYYREGMDFDGGI